MQSNFHPLIVLIALGQSRGDALLLLEWASGGDVFEFVCRSVCLKVGPLDLLVLFRTVEFTCAQASSLGEPGPSREAQAEHLHYRERQSINGFR